MVDVHSISSASSGLDDDLNAELDDTDQFGLKKRLKSTLFIGTYHSKGYVESIRDYRDLVTVSSAAEPHFVQHLQYVKDKLIQRVKPLPYHMWIGATLSPDAQPHSWTIWTELPSGTPFGDYRFKVRTVRFRHNEIIVKLRIVSDADASATQHSGGGGGDNSAAAPGRPLWNDDEPLLEQMQLIGAHIWSEVCVGAQRSGAWIARRDYSWANAFAVCKYGASVISLLVLLAINFVGWLGDFTLRLLVEARHWLVVLMPLLLKLADMANNVVRGLFVLVYVVVRDLMSGLFGGGAGGGNQMNFNMNREPFGMARGWAPPNDRRRAIRY